MAHHVNRAARLGTEVLIREPWYNVSSDLVGWFGFAFAFAPFILVGTLGFFIFFARDSMIEKGIDSLEWLTSHKFTPDNRSYLFVLLLFTWALFTLLFVPFLGFFHRLRSEVRDLTQRVVVAEQNVNRVVDLLPARRRLQVTIGVFDKLLIYTPIYIAKIQGYFDEEGLDVSIVPMRSDKGDESVVDAARLGKARFIACDPVFCLERGSRNGFQIEQGDFRVLLPLVKKFAITAFGRLDSSSDSLRHKKLVTILTYPSPSTINLAALIFKDELQKLIPHVRIDIVGVSSESFRSPGATAEQLSALQPDFVLVWQPQSSWIESHIQPIFGQYGRVVLNGTSYSVEMPGNSSSSSGGATRNDWQPTCNYVKGDHFLVSALLVNKETLEQQPDLCARVYRAVSRGMLSCTAIKWTPAPSDTRQMIAVSERFDKLRSSLEGGPALHEQVLTELTKSDVGLFPFMPFYSPRSYADHLMNQHQFWLHPNGRTVVKNDFGQAFVSRDEYEKYFVDVKTLVPGSSV